MDDYQLVVAFNTDEPAFARGVEIGMLYERLRSAERPIVTTLHADNVEMALRLADAFNCTVRSNDLEDAWLTVTFR